MWSCLSLDQNTGGALLGNFYEDCYAPEISSFRLQYLFAIINKISPYSLTSGTAQWIGRWTRDWETFSGTVSTIILSQFYARPIRPQGYSDTVTVCNRPNSCC